MELKVIIAFSSFVCLVTITIYLAVSKRIDAKLAGVLLLFSIFSLIGIANYDAITLNWMGMTVETAKKEIKTQKDDALKGIGEEVKTQRESIENLIKNEKEALQTLNRTAEAHLDQSLKFGAINAEIQWNVLREEYEDTDRQLRRWEKSQRLERKALVPKSLEELQRALQMLRRQKNINMTENTIQLYFKRYRQYESLKQVAKQYKPFSDRFARVDFSLPSPPRIPSGTVLSGGVLKGGSIR